MKSFLLFPEYVYLVLIQRIEEKGNRMEGDLEKCRKKKKRTFKHPIGIFCLFDFNNEIEFTLIASQRIIFTLPFLYTLLWPQDWKRSVFIPIPKKGNAKECSNHSGIT